MLPFRDYSSMRGFANALTDLNLGLQQRQAFFRMVDEYRECREIPDDDTGNGNDAPLAAKLKIDAARLKNDLKSESREKHASLGSAVVRD